MITSHPYLDNNGPTYRFGVCEHPQYPDCHRPIREHAEAIIATALRGRRRVVSTAPAYREPE